MLEKLRNLLRDDIAAYLHRYVHYDVKVSAALLFTHEETAESIIREHIRPTDKAIRLSKHLFLIIYQYTETEDEAKAATENLIRRLGNEKKNLVAYTTFHESDKNADTIITRLYHIFEDLFTGQHGAIGSDKEYFKELEKFTINVE